MNKMNKHKMNKHKNKFTVNCRCNTHINDMLKEYMKLQGCDRSTAIREILQYFMDLGGVELIK